MVLIFSEEGKYSDEMQIMVKEIKKAIFCLSQEVLDKIHEITKQVVLTAEKPTVTYFELTSLLINYVESLHLEKQEVAEKENYELIQLKQEFAQKEADYKKALAEKEDTFRSRIRKLEYEIRDLNDQVTSIFNLSHPFS